MGQRDLRPRVTRLDRDRPAREFKSLFVVVVRRKPICRAGEQRQVVWLFSERGLEGAVGFFAAVEFEQ